MASCLVTTGGTSGTFRLEYDLGVNHVVSYYNFGDVIYIDDTATDITYTTLTGDVTATSGCVTITDSPQTCYLLKYDRLTTVESTSVFDAIVVGTTVHSFATPCQDILSELLTLVYNVNTVLADDDIKFTALKTENLTDDYVDIYLVVRIMGTTDVPSLRIKSVNNNYSYIIGTVSADCVPSGYYDLGVCLSPAP